MQLQQGQVVYKQGHRSYEAFLARPAGSEPRPAVVLIHEIFGLTKHLRASACRLAEAGYVALAVDLFSSGLRALCVMKTMRDMLSAEPNHNSTRALQAALDYLAQQRFVDPERLGAMGFCMGGNFALALAACERQSFEQSAEQNRQLKVIAPFYGPIPAALKDFKGFCPVVGSFPENDYTREHALRLEAGLTEADVPHDIKIYPNTRHSFMNEQFPVYQPQAAADAWVRTLDFFGAYL